MIVCSVFTVVPLILFKKYYGNQKVFRNTSIVLVIIILILAIYVVTRTITCEFNKDVDCVSNKAIKAKNPKICDKMQQHKTGEYFSRDFCIFW